MTYEKFVEQVKKHKVYTILETWDASNLAAYEKEFGPMSNRQVKKLCGVTERITTEEQAAGEYFFKG